MSRQVVEKFVDPAACCECGCGETVRTIRRDRRRRFIQGHNSRGSTHPSWKGGRIVSPQGYRLIWVPGHNRANPNGYVLEHIVVAERALGKSLPAGALVHHVNEIRHENRNSNLVICQGRAYHSLLHRRMRARATGVDPSWRRCRFCQEYDNPRRLFVPESGDSPYHRRCSAERGRQRYEKRKELSRGTVVEMNGGAS